MSHPFRYLLRVRYSECDAQKVVFNARYGEYVDLAVTEFIRAIGYGEKLFGGEWDFQLVKQTMEWKAPARFDDVLEVSVFSVHLGTTSFTLRSQVRIAGREKLISEAETVYVVVDEDLKKKAISDDLRILLERGAPGVITNHAGYDSGDY